MQVFWQGCFKKGWALSPCPLSSLLTLVAYISEEKLVTSQLYKNA